MVKYQLNLYTPHPRQQLLHQSQARFLVVACGRRFGKTVMAINELAKFAFDHQNTTAWWVAPTYSQSKLAYVELEKLFKNATIRKNATELRLELVNNSIIQCKSADVPDNLRGSGIHCLVMDECAMMPESVWFNVLRPMLSDTGGRCIFISTPRGMNWFHQMYQRGLDDLEPEYAAFQFPTSDNPFVPAAEIEAARRDLPSDVFNQEYMAMFLAESAGVFHGIDKCIQGSYEPFKPSCVYEVGWDPAKHQDFSVVTVLNCTTGHVDYWERRNQCEYAIQLQWVAHIAQQYHASVMMDCNGVGDPLLEQLQALGIIAEGYLFTNQSKKSLIEGLVVGIERQEVTFPDLPVLLGELRSFEYKLSPSRHVQYSAPEGMHDNAVISLALAWHARSHHGPRSVDMLRDLKKRIELQNQHTLQPVQGQIPSQQWFDMNRKKSWWE